MAVNPEVIKGLIADYESMKKDDAEKLERAKLYTKEELYEFAKREFMEKEIDCPECLDDELAIQRLFRDVPDSKELYDVTYAWYLKEGFTADRAKIIADILFVSLAYDHFHQGA